MQPTPKHVLDVGFSLHHFANIKEVILLTYDIRRHSNPIIDYQTA